MVTLFQLHDTDGDGRIDWTDYVRVQSRLCQNTDIGMKEEVETMLNFRVSDVARSSCPSGKNVGYGMWDGSRG